MSTFSLLVAVMGACACRIAAAQASRDSAAIDAVVRPYVVSNNFSGQVLVARGDRIVFERAYGDADRERGVANSLDTRMHVSSVSMQFTAAAILRLVDLGKLTLDTRVSAVVPAVRGGDRITVRNLLEERSGLADINLRPDYARILQQHQTPASLVAVIANDSLLFAPGTRSLHEEHSAYNVLALIVETVTGLPFAAAVRQLVFVPLRMTGSGVDDDALPSSPLLALGYQPAGVSGLEPATPIHWSAKTGNGSAYTTARDEWGWIRALFDGRFLSATSRSVVVDTAGTREGYGWFRRANARFGEFAFEMTGRAPGFSTYVLHLPRSQLTVVVLGNIYSSVTSRIGSDAAALLLGRPFEPFVIGPGPTVAEQRAIDGTSFRFGADFYQPGAVLTFVARDGELFLRWPGGSLSPLIPVSPDRYIDRAYGEPVRIERDSAAQPTAITYGTYRGARSR